MLESGRASCACRTWGVTSRLLFFSSTPLQRKVTVTVVLVWYHSCLGFLIAVTGVAAAAAEEALVAAAEEEELLDADVTGGSLVEPCLLRSELEGCKAGTEMWGLARGLAALEPATEAAVGAALVVVTA